MNTVALLPVFFILFAMVGAVSVLFALRASVRAGRRKRDWTAVEGTIVGRSSGGGTDVSKEGVTAEYRWSDGRSRTVESAMTRTSVPWRTHEGEPITVHVNPNDPDEAAILVGSWGQGAATGLFIAIGVVFVIVGVAAYLVVGGFR